MVPDKMISNINMFGSRVKHRVVGNGNSTCVITKDGNHLIMNIIVTELTFHLQNACTATSNSNILSFS